MPKLPPPPRTAQNKSGWVFSSASNTCPLASTISTESRLSTDSPCVAISHPIPPPRVRPPTPVVEMMPPVVASPWAQVASFTRPQVAPPPTWATRVWLSIVISLIGERSIIKPPSTTLRPAMLCPPPRTDTSSPARAASSSASTTWFVSRQRAISAGRLSTCPLWIRRACSYSASPGRSSSPAYSAAMASKSPVVIAVASFSPC